MGNEGQAYQIQDPSDELRDLLLAYGISTPPANFWLTPLVSPVSIVDSRITLTAQTAPIIPDNFNTAGNLVNPAANTRLFNTGQLAAGNYWFKTNVHLFVAGARIVYRHRNAADTGDILQVGSRVDNYTNRDEFILTLALNERFVVENVVAPGAGIDVQGTVWWTRLT